MSSPTPAYLGISIMDGLVRLISRLQVDSVKLRVDSIGIHTSFREKKMSMCSNEKVAVRFQLICPGTAQCALVLAWGLALLQNKMQSHLRLVVSSVDGLCRLCRQLARLVLNLIDATLDVWHVRATDVVRELL